VKSPTSAGAIPAEPNFMGRPRSSEGSVVSSPARQTLAPSVNITVAAGRAQCLFVGRTAHSYREAAHISTWSHRTGASIPSLDR
jgi:hypothetical protein